MGNAVRAATFAFLAVLAAFALVGCSEEDGASTQNTGSQALARAAQIPERIPAEEPVARVAAAVGPSVVQVNIRLSQESPFGTQQAQEGLGSGVIYREDGYIITNDHVVRGASEVSVAFADGTIERAEVVGGDPGTEIAVLRVNRNDLPAARFSEGAETLLPGQLAVAIGSPSGFESTVTSGVISGIGRDFPPELLAGDENAARSLVDLVQTDAAISPGNSGGALADRNGEIIGVNVAYLPPAQTGAVNIGFAIPSDTATSIADQLIETGRVSTAYLGVETSDLSPEAAERFEAPVNSGAIVAETLPGSAADDAGIRRGDIIIAVDDEPVENSGDLLGALRDYQPGDTAGVTVIRDGEEIAIDVTLGARPGE